jgi:hypothetical protein
MELKGNQSALILETDEQGEVNVNVASGDHDGLTAAICTVIAERLMGDEQFQEEIMGMIESDDGE